jgi:hypothetical protein
MYDILFKVEGVEMMKSKTTITLSAAAINRTRDMEVRLGVVLPDMVDKKMYQHG